MGGDGQKKQKVIGLHKIAKICEQVFISQKTISGNGSAISTAASAIG